MPRQMRKKSNSGIYNIMLRGINRQTIFNDEEDCQKLLDTLKRYKKISGYKLFAYCLMSNHVHLLIKVENEDLGLIMKRVAGSYVYWYNWKYKRTGHLFQDRFKSEPVEDDSYFLTVLRYIHQNPVKAGLCKEITDYKYSSYNEYVEDGNLVDTDFIYGIIDRDQFVLFNNEYSDDVCLEIIDNSFRMTDNEAKEIMLKICKSKKIDDIQKMNPDKRDLCLKLCRESGISIRQLCRLTGVSFGVIRNI